jgi:hypothetical protein
MKTWEQGKCTKSLGIQLFMEQNNWPNAQMHKDNRKTYRVALHELMNLQQFCQHEKQNGKLQNP